MATFHRHKAQLPPSIAAGPILETAWSCTGDATLAVAVAGGHVCLLNQEVSLELALVRGAFQFLLVVVKETHYELAKSVEAHETFRLCTRRVEKAVLRLGKPFLEFS